MTLTKLVKLNMTTPSQKPKPLRFDGAGENLRLPSQLKTSFITWTPGILIHIKKNKAGK